MAVPNMIVTLLAKTEGYAKGLKSAANQTTLFGKAAAVGIGLAATAVVALTRGIFELVPALIKLGQESRVADIKLQYIAQNMSGLGKATDTTVTRLQEYARVTQNATGVDDEAIKAIQAKLLLFKGLTKTAGQTNGMFDRVTQASLDLAVVAGQSADMLGGKIARLMAAPIKNIAILNRANFVFTEQEKRKAEALAASNGKMAAADYLMGRIEARVGGLAEQTADPLKKIQNSFADIGEAIGEKLWKGVDTLAKRIQAWVDSPGGQKAIQKMVDGVSNLIDYFTSPDGQRAIDNWISKLSTLADVTYKLLDYMLRYAQAWQDAADQHDRFGGRFYAPGLGSGGGTGGGSGGGTGGGSRGGGGSNPVVADRANIYVNFNAPVDSVSAGREVKRVLDDYHRANGGR